MAKINARGATRLAEATEVDTLDDGTVVTRIYTLRSDGVVLIRRRFRNDDGSSFGEGHRVLTRLGNASSDRLLDAFDRYIGRRGLTRTR